MSDQSHESLKGQFLIAMPLLADPNFHKSVTCICEHSDRGAMGVIINRAIPDFTAQGIFEELGIQYQAEAAQIPVHLGGPVHTDELFIVHGPPFGWKGCLLVTSGLGLSNTLDVITAIAAGKGPENFLIALGCAGWGPGQLEAEIQENAWLNCDVDEKLVFESTMESRWDLALRGMGIDPALLSDAAGHA